MNYVKIYRQPKNSVTNQIIGIVNAKLLESIQWVLRPGAVGEPVPDRYELHGSYYGSSADVDFVLTMNTLISTQEGGPSPGSPAAEFDTEGKRAKIMNIIVNGITKACQATYTSPGSTVISYYPPFDVGVDFVIESNPFAPADELLPPGEEYLEKEGLFPVEVEPIGEGPFGGPGSFEPEMEKAFIE